MSSKIGQQLQELLRKEKESVHKQTVTSLKAIGERAVAHARETNRSRYEDRTGNLTSSIGYAVCVDGEIVEMSSFESVLNGTEGSEKGRSYVKEQAANTKGVSLVMVAGMPYAEYVERKGFDVLDSAIIQAEDEVEKQL